MSKTFKQLLSEAKAQHAVLTFGRFQPPTVGHEKLVGVLAATAKRKGGTPFLFPSRTNDKKKNPLTPKAKVKFLKRVFPQVTVVDDAGSRTIFEALDYLVKKGFKTATIVVGGDRIGEFEKTVVPYTDKIGMDNIDFVGAGARDPDATGVEGMSASKLRAAALDGDFDTFRSGMPKKASSKDSKMLYDEIRKVMGANEEYDEDSLYGTDGLRKKYQRDTPGQ